MTAPLEDNDEWRDLRSVLLELADAIQNGAYGRPVASSVVVAKLRQIAEFADQEAS